MIEFIEIRDVPAPELARAWMVRVRSRQGEHSLRALLGGRELSSVPKGCEPLERLFTEDEIRGAVQRAVRLTLVSPHPEPLPPDYEVNVTSHDLYAVVEGRD